MKRVCMTFLILVASFAIWATATTIQTKQLMLQGAYEDVLEVAVDPIPAQSTSFMQGMPFNIENSLTWSGVSQLGREIAYWHFIANCDFKIEVIAPHLSIESDNQYYSVAEKLPYTLTFVSSPSFTDTNLGDVVNLTTTFTASSLSEADIASGSKTEWELFPEGGSYSYTGETYVGSSQGSIYFQFTPAATSSIRATLGDGASSRVPAGDWGANVIIRMVAK